MRGLSLKMARRWAALLLALCLLAGCAHGALQGEGEGEVTIFQVSTIDALMEGAYQGQATFAELARHGDFGLGTFQDLDGEMVALDGRFYQVKADGKAYAVAPEMKTPFADVLFFQTREVLRLKGEMDLDQLEQAIDAALPTSNLFYAVRVDGPVQYLKVRSVPPQSRPYPKLAEAVKHQSVYEYQDIEGSLVGLRCPAFAKGINVTGYHMHFLDKTRQVGGHVLNLKVKDPVVRVAVAPRLLLALPQSGEFLHSDLAVDHEADLKKVEKGR